MNVIQNILSLFYEVRTPDFVVYWLAHQQVPDGLPREPLDADKHYLKVDLRSLRVVHVQRGLTKFYGIVNSHIALPHLGQGEAEFQTVVAPPELKDTEARNLDRFLSFDKPLAGPVPFRGGNLRIQVGLFSVASANLLAPYVSLMEEIAQKSSVEFITSAVPYAGLLSKGLGLLAMSSNAKLLEIGVSTNCDPVQSGWLLVMRANLNEWPPERLAKLTVAKDDGKLLEGGSPLADSPYLILRFSGQSRRDDWFKIPELREQHQVFVQALRKGDRNEVQPALTTFQRFVHTCPDLLTADAKRVVDEAKADADRLYPAAATATHALAALQPLSLEQYEIYASECSST